MGLSTHILDTSRGRPAAGVSVALFIERDGTWHPLAHGVTDTEGRCKTLLGEAPLEPRTYRLRFECAPYFQQQSHPSLYPFIEITFTVTDPNEHHHIPLLLAANGYTTYRGS